MALMVDFNDDINTIFIMNNMIVVTHINLEPKPVGHICTGTEKSSIILIRTNNGKLSTALYLRCSIDPILLPRQTKSVHHKQKRLSTNH